MHAPKHLVLVGCMSDHVQGSFLCRPRVSGVQGGEYSATIDAPPTGALSEPITYHTCRS